MRRTVFFFLFFSNFQIGVKAMHFVHITVIRSKSVGALRVVCLIDRNCESNVLFAQISAFVYVVISSIANGDCEWIC